MTLNTVTLNTVTLNTVTLNTATLKTVSPKNDSLRALHLFANYKWTGPADPAIRSAAGLRALGVDLAFAQAQHFDPGLGHPMAEKLRQQSMPVIAGMQLRKHLTLRSLRQDARVLRQRIKRGDFTLLHSHLLGDHCIAAWAKRGLSQPVALVRSFYDAQAPKLSFRHRLAMAQTDGVVVSTPQVAKQCQQRYGLESKRVLVQEPSMALQRMGQTAGDMRSAWGLGEEDVCIGLTARIQPHRRFDLCWQAARLVVDQAPRTRFVLLGRGSEKDIQKWVREPIQRLGLKDNVILPGYLTEPYYSHALQTLQVFMFLVPGSDGTCRAVREAMAAALPVVSTKRGMLPHLLGAREEGEAREACGICVDEEPEAMATALLSLVQDPLRRQSLGHAAQQRVRLLMDPAVASRRLLDFYHWLGENPR